MERVPQRVLNWLHSVLIGEYSDVNRTFADVAQTLEGYNSLRPSTDVYTFENGGSALLLHLTGTLPVSFRGGRYAIPVSIWIPKSYPHEAPIAFVTPTQEMAVRPGQHISGEGRIYHPMLASWGSHSQLPAFVRILQEVFSREPPVVAKQVTGPRIPTQPSPAPPRPPLPNELRRESGPKSQTDGPPLLPPKPFEQRPNSTHSPPFVPPRPFVQSPELRAHIQPPLHGAQPGWQQAPWQSQTQPQSSRNSIQPSSIPPQQYQSSPQFHATVSQNLQQPPPVQPAIGRQMSIEQHAPPQQYHQQYAQPNIPQQIQSQIAPQPKQPAMDLLTSPFDPPLPTHSNDIPAPAIPPNPEKNALLSAISHSLNLQLRSTISANESAIQPLSAQNAAMTHALYKLQQERGALLQLQSLLDSNEKILHQAMRDADECIASAQHKAIPGVDEVLVAPTVVGQQLYDLTADVKACTETRDVLARALDRGRISSETWIKTTRSLAREEFLKKILIRRCAEGMGLQRTPMT